MIAISTARRWTLMCMPYFQNIFICLKHKDRLKEGISQLLVPFQITALGRGDAGPIWDLGTQCRFPLYMVNFPKLEYLYMLLRVYIRIWNRGLGLEPKEFNLVWGIPRVILNIISNSSPQSLLLRGLYKGEEEKTLNDYWYITSH